MKKILGVVAFAVSTAAFAAPPSDKGTITIKGTVPEMLSISSATETILAGVIDFTAELAADTTGAKIAETIPFRLRSNVAYALVASVKDNSAVGNDVLPADIGIAVADATGSGTKVMGTSGAPASRTDTAATLATGTLADFPTTVAGDVSGDLQILSGTRISAKGGTNSPDNFLGSSITASIVPQFFAPNLAFEYVMTLTMVSP